MSLPDPYGRVPWRGVTMDRITVAALTAVEEKLGRPIDTVYQGSYHTGVGNSAGTHDGGGAIDCYDRDPQTLCWLMRDVGCFGSWIRNPSQGPWPYHIHGVLYGNMRLVDLAESQVDMYRKGYNGLGWYDYKDDFGRRPSPIVPFNYHGVTEIDMDFKDQIPGTDSTVGDALKAALQTKKALSEFRVNVRASGKAESHEAKQMEEALVMRLNRIENKVLAELDVLGSEGATGKQLASARQRIVQEIKSVHPTPEKNAAAAEEL